MDPNIKFMIVEDQDIVSLGLKMSLEQYPNLQFLGLAKDGEQAVEMAISLKPDVIIMDLGLPKLDGIEATRKITQIDPVIKILIMSSRDKASDIFACFAVGAAGYCRKDASAGEVYASMQAILSGQLTIESSIAGNILACWRDLQSSGSLTDSQGQPFALSEIDLQIISMIADGLNNKSIADKLGLTVDSLGQHKQQLRHNLAALGSLLVELNEGS
ncbi:MAG: response regulator transcription factor [Cyanobacteria bacterium SZAS LIN-3]|nr:response regulator transcription factor [Cyanobacteria bacterium SZAS LIN-3]MBS2007404.1 response regulator transcription factor [Cyanobacteria bacterium SZAS TMP-1]